MMIIMLKGTMKKKCCVRTFGINEGEIIKRCIKESVTKILYGDRSNYSNAEITIGCDKLYVQLKLKTSESYYDDFSINMRDNLCTVTLYPDKEKTLLDLDTYIIKHVDALLNNCESSIALRICVKNDIHENMLFYGARLVDNNLNDKCAECS